MPKDSRDARTLGLLLLGAWTLLNLLQAGLTELDPDEAYYWMYARHLAWGFFDHPPAIALMIRAGVSLLPGELGVRLWIVLLQSAGFWLLWDLLGRPCSRTAVLTLAALLAGMPLLEVYGFIATPDSPLLFFTLFFFWSYRRFLRRADGWAVLWLGVAMAALLYSKYHGLLVIGFTFLSNPKLVLRPRFYLASGIGLALFFPHLYWQYAHDFPSFRYHLVGRDDPYELKHTVTYLVNQLIIFNPLFLPFLSRALNWREWRADGLARAFLFTVFGFWVFFFLTTFKGHAEPQWTAVLSIPLVYFLFHYALRKERAGWWLRWLGLLSFVLFLGARLTLLTPALAFDFNKEFHRQAWTFELRALADGRPVIFQNSYRDASKYAFYTGEAAYTFTDKDYRPNQFDIWRFEENLHNREVLLAAHKGWSCEDCRLAELTRKAYRIKWVDSLQVTQKIEVRPLIAEATWTAGDSVGMAVRIDNPYDHPVIRGAGNMPIRFAGLFYGQAEKAVDSVEIRPQPLTDQIPAKAEERVTFRFRVPDGLAGDYRLVWAIRTGDLPPAIRSRPVPVRIIQSSER